MIQASTWLRKILVKLFSCLILLLELKPTACDCTEELQNLWNTVLEYKRCVTSGYFWYVLGLVLKRKQNSTLIKR